MTATTIGISTRLDAEDMAALERIKTRYGIKSNAQMLRELVRKVDRAHRKRKKRAEK